MRKENIDIVYNALWECRQATKKALAQITGLSTVTVGTILDQLIAEDKVMAGELVASLGGRPAQSYLFNEKFAHFLVISAQSVSDTDTICGSVANLFGEVVLEKIKKVARVQVGSFDSMISECLRSYPTIRTLAFSLPGVERDGVIVANDFKELEGAPFTKHFEDRYGLPAVVENDVNLAVAGYCSVTETSPLVVGIYFPRRYPPGAGIVIDGSVVKGESGKAGEVSLMPLGIDWMNMNYQDRSLVSQTISRLMWAICSVIDPGTIVLYGDFLEIDIQQDIICSMRRFSSGNKAPSIVFQKDITTDITYGLIAKAKTLYRSVTKE